MTTTHASLNQVLSQRTDDDHLLDGQPFGRHLSELQASTSVSHVAPHQMSSSVTTATSLCTSEEPDAESCALPMPAAELTAASSRLRPDPALSKALKRLLDGEWTYQNEDELVIRFEPRSRGRGKKRPSSYITTHDSCSCPGAIIRGGCYHPTAWQIVSEALVPTTSIECTLPSAMFIPLCLLALSAGTEHLALSADTGQGTLALLVPNIVTGTLTVEMITPVLLLIEQQVCAADLKRIVDALADALPLEGEQITIELSAGSLLVIAGAEEAPVLVDGLDTLPLDSHTP